MITGVLDATGSASRQLRNALTAVNPLLTAQILAANHTPFASMAVRFNNLGTASVADQMHQHSLARKNIGDSCRV